MEPQKATADVCGEMDRPVASANVGQFVSDDRAHTIVGPLRSGAGKHDSRSPQSPREGNGSAARLQNPDWPSDAKGPSRIGGHPCDSLVVQLIGLGREARQRGRLNGELEE